MHSEASPPGGGASRQWAGRRRPRPPRVGRQRARPAPRQQARPRRFLGDETHKTPELHKGADEVSRRRGQVIPSGLRGRHPPCDPGRQCPPGALCLPGHRTRRPAGNGGVPAAHWAAGRVGQAALPDLLPTPLDRGWGRGAEPPLEVRGGRPQSGVVNCSQV